MKLVFMGTPEFAVPSLLALNDAGIDIAGVFTQPDKPRGRGMKTQASPVAVAAVALGIPTFKPFGFKDGEAAKLLRDISPDVIAVVAYGRILPLDVLNIPALGCVNAHASILPKYRGAAPIQWAVANGETVTGISTMYMSEGMDEGDVIATVSVDILPDETAGELHDRLKIVAAKLLSQTVLDISAGKTDRHPQDGSRATYAPIIKKDDGRINWNKPSSEIVNLIRGMSPWPSAFSTIGGVQMRILKAENCSCEVNSSPGSILCANQNDGLVIATGDGALRISILQPIGGKPMSSNDYMRGHKIETNA